LPTQATRIESPPLEPAQNVKAFHVEHCTGYSVRTISYVYL